MASLVIAEHNGNTLLPSTLSTITVVVNKNWPPL